MRQLKYTTSLLTIILAATAGIHPVKVRAAPYLLPQVPLIVSVRSIPNVWFQLDDSGSMDWELMMKFHYPACLYDSVLRCTTSDTPEQGRILDWNGESSSSGVASMYSYEYIFSLSDHTYGNVCPSIEDSYNSSLEKCKLATTGDVTHRGTTIPYRQDWRARSSDLNVMYFSPGAEYLPWQDSNASFTNASFTSARSWPVLNESGYTNTRSLAGFQYNVWIDDKGFKGSTPDPNASDVISFKNGIIDEWDSYIRVTVNSASSFSCEKVTHSPQTYSYSNSSTNELRGINPTATTLTVSDPACVAATAGLGAAQLAQDVANWYQYYRRRTHVMRAAVGRVVGQLPEFRYGTGSINKTSSNYPIPNTDILDYFTNNKKVLDMLYGTDRTATGTPLRKGLGWVGEYLKGSISGLPSPILNSCQKNFTLLFSDGFWNGSTPSTPSGDTDKDGQTISESSILLADVARHYYITDLRNDIANAVPTDAFDAANWQHMVTYGVGFGVKGYLVDTDGDGWPDPKLDVSSDWTQSSNDDLNKVDDMWHASWNARGSYFAAERPQDLVDDVASAVQDIGRRFGGAASAAANSGSISSSSKIFQAKFDTTDWHGELLAFQVGDDGTLSGASLWNANTLLSAKSSTYLGSNAGGRNVWTWNNDGATTGGTAFEWNSISPEQQALLNMDHDGVVDSLGAARLRYIRGDSGNEQKAEGLFRNRDSKLGDIVNSDLVYVGFPPFFYSFDNYNAFFQSQVNRTGMIYFGANDGMFHAVREADGEEVFAYVPDKVYENLPQLTNPYYIHEYYVDGPPQYGDVQINGAWKSVVASGLRAGGQGIFALDVTNPDSFSASNVLWEFTDEVDADLGYTFGQPQIKRMANDKWAVIIGSGVNNTEADQYTSTSGAAAVFIIFIEDGIDGWASTDYVKLSVPGGSPGNPNAIFTPAAADLDGDARVDVIYAGDRNGKMWKFDVSGKLTGSWGLAFNGQPFFDAGTGHPITDRPVIAPHPMGYHLGELVLFGTGQFIEYADNTTDQQPTQTMYAIWDLSPGLAAKYQSNGYSRSQLSAGSFTVDSGVRVIGSGTDVNWLDKNNLPDQRGWYIDLPLAGERIHRRPILRNDLVFFTTLIPDEDPCSAGGIGWIMVLDTATGLAPGFPVFDIDADLDVTTDGDTVGSDPANPLVPTGVQLASIPNLPAFVYDDRPEFSATTAQFPPVPNSSRGCGDGNARAYTFTTQANGSIMAIETATESLSCGRQSWRSEK